MSSSTTTEEKFHQQLLELFSDEEGKLHEGATEAITSLMLEAKSFKDLEMLTEAMEQLED